MGKETATLFSTFTLHNAEKEKINKVFISENESVAVVTFESG